MKTYPNSKALVLAKRKDLDGRRLFIESFGFKQLYFINDMGFDYDYAISIGWGSYHVNRHLCRDKNLLHIEGAYLRSFLMDRSGSIFDEARCFFVDTLGWHYDPNHPSLIENLLNTYQVTDEQKQRASDFIKLLIDNKVTKFNDQLEIVDLPKGHNVLVVDSTVKDQAVLKSGGTDNSFTQLLNSAIKENPDSNIIVKLHPDSLNNRRSGYYDNLTNPNIHLVNVKVNPFDMLSQVDKVYTFSSTLGVESLMMQKETHVFGMPCYAGWGLTYDRMVSKKRTRKLTIEELVYIIYFVYTQYIDESPEDYVKHLLDLKREYIKCLNTYK